MRRIWITFVTAFAATSVSAFPLGNRGLVTADVISSSADEPVKRNNALHATEDKKSSRSLRIPSPTNILVKRQDANDQRIDPWIEPPLIPMSPIVDGVLHSILDSPPEWPSRSWDYCLREYSQCAWVFSTKLSNISINIFMQSSRSNPLTRASIFCS